MKFIREHNLARAVKRFRQINEYTYYAPRLTEDDEDEAGAPPESDAPESDAPESDTPEQAGPAAGPSQDAIPPEAGIDDDPDGAAAPMGPDGPMPDDSTPGPDAGPDAMPGNTEPMQAGDEVIDVDDLTDAQEKTKGKVDKMAKHLGDLLKAVVSIKHSLDANNAKIIDLQKDFERRNPTETEKLNIRTQDSYPFSENPGQYWSDKGAQKPNYQISMDNEDVTTPESYTLTQGDINTLSKDGPGNIGDTFDYTLNLKNVLDF